MELITAIEKKKIKDCKVGDVISGSKTIDKRFPYFNIVVPKSVTVEIIKDKHPITRTNKENDIEDYAFNVIAFEDGRVRTFHPEVEVWVFNKSDIFI
ncbi:MAG: hypothetical protein M0R03_16430 [Novosphingobium sp.]|nr:hypothetical protein [Novosphingobium sp.]